MNFASNESWQVTFPHLPTSLSQLKALPEAALRAPHQTAALLIPALCLWPDNKDEALRMISFLKGPQPPSPYEIQFITERLRGNDDVPRSYFEGARPENNYRPDLPHRLIITAVPTSFHEAGYAQLYLSSGGADSPRPAKLRQKPSTGEWFLWDQMLLAQIRKPAAQDPWA